MLESKAYGLLKLKTEILFGIQRSGDADQHLRKVGIDTPVSALVGVGQGTARDFASDAGMIELGLKGPQTGLYISKALSIGQLREGHAQELIEAGEFSESVIALVTAHALVELVSWQEIHQLREDNLSRVHWPSLSTLGWKKDDLDTGASRSQVENSYDTI